VEALEFQSGISDAQWWNGRIVKESNDSLLVSLMHCVQNQRYTIAASNDRFPAYHQYNYF
jgi:hypothetical protein